MKLYNTLTREVEKFSPKSKQVSMYSCGLTVYSQPHIGNWVVYIYWDVLVSTLKSAGYKIKQVQNITDVGHLTSDEDAGEDKMLKSALIEGLTAWDVADKYIKIADHEMFEVLKLRRPNFMPRATEYIKQQIDFVSALEEKGYTYKLKDGIYFDTSKLKDYGKLARLDIKGLQFGARVKDTGKNNPTDFAVWKFSPIEQKRDMEWDSPWGKGFPGWHLECSVMARELLGDQIDIHTGGIDHIPVHHTNEIAQTEAITGKQFAKYWLHANHLKVNGTKMSKSLGNLFTLEDVIKKGFSPESFKMLVLSKHYRTEGNFTWNILKSSQERLNRWHSYAVLKWQLSDETNDKYTPDSSSIIKEDIFEPLQNDLNTPQVIANIDKRLEEFANAGITSKNIHVFEEYIEAIDEYLGIGLTKQSDITSKQKTLLEQRKLAREAKDWQLADELRDKLEQQGVLVRDTGKQQIWSRI